jgi:rsbT antagonist protein RsbS
MHAGMHGASAGRAGGTVDNGPALVSILRQGPYLIASIHTALDDSQLVHFQRDLLDRIGLCRSTGIIIDVAALDVLDSFGSRTLRNIAEMASLRGAVAVLVGIQPDVAFAMVELGLHTSAAHTALDLEEGLAYLGRAGSAAVSHREIASRPQC